MPQTSCRSLLIPQDMTRLGAAERGRNPPEPSPAGSVARRRPFERWGLKLPLVARGTRETGVTRPRASHAKPAYATVSTVSSVSDATDGAASKASTGS